MIKRFQFQNGTIKSVVILYLGAGTVIFQFQNGTIKSLMSLRFTSPHVHFNSRMVRLKVLNRPSGCSSRSFQFQNGTIKSVCLIV